MKVLIPKRYAAIFEVFKPLFTIRDLGEHVEIETPIGFELSRARTGMRYREFKELFNAIQVYGGKKRWKHRKITVDPKRDERFFLRLSAEELVLIKAAAGRKGVTPSEYCRSAILEQVLNEALQDGSAGESP